MSILPPGWWDWSNDTSASASAPADTAMGQGAHTPHSTQTLTPAQCDALLGLVCSSGRPFALIQVRVVKREGGDEDSGAGSSAGAAVYSQTKGDATTGDDDDVVDITPGSGEVGEVWCRGPTVFSGYWGDQEGTQRSFAPRGWFKTGDLAQVGHTMLCVCIECLDVS
jgi:acyl-CoA synthetase (AMP-forming)/AMP-acid ligase II